MTFKMTEAAAEAGKLMEGALSGDSVDKAKFLEALTTGDITPGLLAAPLTARVITEYEGLEDTTEGVVVRNTVDDFNLQEVYRLSFSDDSQVLEKNNGKARVAGTLPRVAELGEYQTFGFSSTNESYRAFKSGIKFEISWESVINGRRLNLIERATSQMARMARATEAAGAYEQYVSASALSSNLATSGDVTNVLTGNPALTADSLESALALAATHKVNGERVALSGAYTLLVPPTLEMTARKILSTTEVRTTSGSKTYISGNPLQGKFNLKVSDTLLRINSSADNYWFIIPDLSQTDGFRPELWFVRGEETPKVFVKSTTAQDPSEGDFDHDAWATKIRHTATGVNTGMLGVVASNGSGS